MRRSLRNLHVPLLVCFVKVFQFSVLFNIIFLVTVMVNKEEQKLLVSSWQRKPSLSLYEDSRCWEVGAWGGKGRVHRGDTVCLRSFVT